jgi:hypothetical protein
LKRPAFAPFYPKTTPLAMLLVVLRFSVCTAAKMPLVQVAAAALRRELVFPLQLLLPELTFHGDDLALLLTASMVRGRDPKHPELSCDLNRLQLGYFLLPEPSV